MNLQPQNLILHQRSRSSGLHWSCATTTTMLTTPMTRWHPEKSSSFAKTASTTWKQPDNSSYFSCNRKSSSSINDTNTKNNTRLTQKTDHLPIFYLYWTKISRVMPIPALRFFSCAAMCAQTDVRPKWFGENSTIKFVDNDDEKYVKGADNCARQEVKKWGIGDVAPSPLSYNDLDTFTGYTGITNYPLSGRTALDKHATE